MFNRSRKKPIVTEPLSPTALLRLLATLSLVLAPHLQHLPPWAIALVIAVVIWRGFAVVRHWRMLPTSVRVVLAFAAFGGIYFSFGRVSGQTAGVALITVMAALKLTELRARRDTMVLVFLMYFMLITHFLFSQEIWTVAYLLVCASLITMVLIDANHPGTALPWKVPLRLGSRYVLQALPLMAIIFVLFPRIPGPLWGLPSDSGAGRSGLSDSMSPGDISSLIQSNEVAFRVRFDGEPPPMRERYWRGPVFGSFDGRRWDGGVRPTQETPIAQLSGRVFSYEVVLEPNRAPWLFSLDLPVRSDLPQDSVLNADYQLVLTKGDVRERKLYRLSSQTKYRLQPELPQRLRDLMLRMPKNSNPRTRQLGQEMRDQGLSDAQIVDSVLGRFRTEKYYYTLKPPALGRDGVDQFLFDTRRGFCEHYAGSFTLLMRAAGVPARIVTGYQGGERNDVGDYYIVRQSDAHAWSEVWLEGRGWVRVDPTAAVSPNRVERGIGEAFAGTDELPASLDPTRRNAFAFDLVARWDWANAQWNHWVLGYGPELQQEFLSRFGLLGWSDMIIALTILLTIGLTLFGIAILRRSNARIIEDDALRAWRRLQKKLARAGFPQRREEGPRDYARRVAGARPDLADTVTEAATRYLAARYLVDDRTTSPRELREAIARVRP